MKLQLFKMNEAYPNLSNLHHISDQLSGQSLIEKPIKIIFMCLHTFITPVKFSLHLIYHRKFYNLITIIFPK
jgi:hypothetical protein